MRILLVPAFALHISAKCVRFADVMVLPDLGEPAARGPCGRRNGRLGECMFVLILASITCGWRAYCCWAAGEDGLGEVGWLRTAVGERPWEGLEPFEGDLARAEG